jgi:hypothetical protein
VHGRVLSDVSIVNIVLQMASITGVSNVSARETHSPHSMYKVDRASKRNARADNHATFTPTEFGSSACLEMSLGGGAARVYRRRGYADTP